MSRTPTSRLALSKPDPGTGEPYDPSIDLGSNWDKVDGGIGATPCTSGTRPGTPFNGQIIRESDTGKMYVWSTVAAAWMQILIDIGSGGFQGDDQMDIRRATSGSLSYATRVTGDTQDRWQVSTGGVVWFGPGNAAQDTNIYRVAADSLKTDDTFTSAVDIIVGSRSLGRGIMGTPQATSTNGTTFTNAGGVRDTVLGNFAFTAVSGRRYRVCYTGAKYNVSANGNNLASVNIRDGGASTPTTASTLIANGSLLVTISGGGGQQSLNVFGTFLPTAGTHTLAVFNDGNTAVTYTPVALRELYVEDIGPV